MITHERLTELLHYDPDTGALTWRVGRRGRAWAGSVAGYIDGQSYRFITLSMTGKWPEHQIDHINCVRSDDRFCNLREATPSQNSSNRGKQGAGYKGITFHKRLERWQAQIKHEGRGHYLGLFATPELAHEAYCRAARELHGKYARTA